MMIAIYFAIIFVISNVKWNDCNQNINNTIASQMVREKIYTPEQYLAFVESVNSGNSYENCEVSLQSDLDFSHYDKVIPIGVAGEEGISFLGTFNGNGYTISGVTMERPGDYAGLFVNLGGIVKNLQVKDSIFVGKVCGIIATDTINASILNCYVDAKVYGEIAGSVVV